MERERKREKKGQDKRRMGTEMNPLDCVIEAEEGIVPGHDGVIFPLPTSQTIIYIRRIWKFAQALLPVSGIVSSGTHARPCISCTVEIWPEAMK
ncbi:hypothetical protein OUZ56_014008 [Daphnia magna]|uniref:Uncharacterized protein n=1 Tax=Daphnia magna TaxID=35525 RepID=A0ABQ9Z7L6_9CRUS|nr:hypothetical protein OUZ56_014008 [Daphnia magna]